MTNYLEEGTASISFGTNSLEKGDYLQWQKKRLSPLSVDFSWTPRMAVSQACGNINIEVDETDINTLIVFTLIQDSTEDHYIQAIKWDFGDGTFSYYDSDFSSMTHIFTVANFQDTVTMVAIDNFDNDYVVTHPVYLVNGDYLPVNIYMIKSLMLS